MIMLIADNTDNLLLGSDIQTHEISWHKCRRNERKIQQHQKYIRVVKYLVSC